MIYFQQNKSAIKPPKPQIGKAVEMVIPTPAQMHQEIKAITQQLEIKPIELKAPPIAQRVANLGQSIVRNAKAVLRGQPLKETDEEAQRRLSVCRACPKFMQPYQICSICGCFMKAKTYLRAEKCPDKPPRW